MIHAHHPLNVIAPLPSHIASCYPIASGMLGLPSGSPAGFAPLYHVFQRGNNHNYIYRSRCEKQHFLDILEELYQQYNFDILFLVIMDNHFHMIFEDCGTCLPRVMRLLQWQYSWYYNHEHDRTGTNYEGRYHKIHIQNTSQLQHLAHYLAYNPVVARMVAHPVDYPWSTHRSIINNSPTFVATDKLVELFGSTIDIGRSRYISIMEQPSDGIVDRTACPAVDASDLALYLHRILAEIIPDVDQISRMRGVECPKSLYTERRVFIKRALELNYTVSSIAHFLHCEYHIVRTVAANVKHQDKQCRTLGIATQSEADTQTIVSE